MGVPFAQINEKFELGFKQFEGWDLPFTGKEPNKKEVETEKEKRSLVLIPTEKRNVESEIKRKNKIADGPVKDAYADLLKRQGKAVYAALGKDEDVNDAVRGFNDELVELTRDVYFSVAAQFANTVVIDSRGISLNFQKRGNLEDELIEEFLAEEQIILAEASAIQQSTIKTIFDQIRNSSEQGFNYDQLRQALDDTGIFSPARALRIARTEVGTAASIGQMSSAKVAGAEFKTWETAGAKTRQAHINREGEEVSIDERFSEQISSVGPRFPLDPQISVSDRVNCDCFMTFRVD